MNLRLSRRYPSLFTPVLSAALLLGGCKKDEPPKAEVTRPIKMLTVGEGSTGGTLDFPGRIRAASEATLSFEVDGKLEKLHVSEGQRVSKGTALAEINNRDYVARLEEAQAEEKEAKARYERGKELFATDAVSKQDLDVDRRGFEVAMARLKTAQKAVEDTILRAPFDGIVAKRFVENFEQVRAKQDVIFFHAEDGLEVTIDVPERIMRAYAGPGAKSDDREDSEKEATSRFKPTVVVEGAAKPIPARFSEIATAADPVTRTFEIKLAFDKPEDIVTLPGMSAKVVIDVAAANKNAPLLIPARAVAATADKAPSVFVVKRQEGQPMTVERRLVEVGKMSGEDIVVKKGLNSGETIALSGLTALRDGKQVTEYSRTQKK